MTAPVRPSAPAGRPDRETIEAACRDALASIAGEPDAWEVLRALSPNKAALIRILVARDLAARARSVALPIPARPVR